MGMERVEATGVVLAGGASRRMGRDKAALMLDGEPLLARVVRRLGVVTSEVLVVGPAERAALVPEVRVVPDARVGMGPMGGIYTALLAAHTERIFVAACDMPFVKPALVRYLLGLAKGYAVVVPRTERGTEQMHAVYTKACLGALEVCMAAGELAVARLYGRVATREVERGEWEAYDAAGESMVNVNTEGEWEEALRRAGDGEPPFL
jgi:molybdopterin-guanine dinucleotide biosynthesis protein A